MKTIILPIEFNIVETQKVVKGEYPKGFWILSPKNNPTIEFMLMEDGNLYYGLRLLGNFKLSVFGLDPKELK